MSDDVRSTPTAAVGVRLRPWTLPRLVELPKLTALTLASAIGGGGGTTGGGSTVFGLLLAVVSLLLLPACSADRAVTPGDAATPSTVASIPCMANVAERTVVCGGPLTAPGQEILGGQGVRVVLRSTNITYLLDTFRFDVTVQNLATQSIGTNGIAKTGVKVFFQDQPVATAGAGLIDVIAPDTALFTAPLQPYYTYPDSLVYQAISSSVTWEFGVPAGVTSFAFTVLVAADVRNAGGPLRWRDVAGLGSVALYELAANGGNDAMAVGNYGHSIRWIGGVWTPMASVTQDDLFGVAGLGAGQYVAAGYDGRIFRSKGNVWTQVHTRADGNLLTSFWALDGSNFVGAGVGGAVTWYWNGVYTDEVVGAGEDFYKVTGTRDGTLVTAITNAGEVFTATGPGAWGPGDPQVVAPNVPLDIVYDADNDLLLSYFNPSSFEGFIRHDGVDLIYQATAELPVRLFPFDGDSVSVLVADLFAGDYVDKVRYGASPVHDRSTVTDTAPMFTTNGIALDAARTKFLLSDGATLWFKNGGPFTQVAPSVSCGCFSGMWGVADTVWVVDGSTSLWKVVGGAWTELTAPPGAYKIWGFSSHELYVTADSQVWKGDGVGSWLLQTSLVGNGDYLNEIWGDPASGLLIAIGDGGRFMARQSGTWTQGLLTANVDGVWGCSGTEAWMSSQDGPIFHWESGVVVPDTAYDFDHAPGNWNHGTISGTSCTDVWVAGEDNFVFHWTGTNWDSLSTGIGPVSVGASVMKGPGEVYLGGDFGVVALLTASGSMTRMQLPTQGNRVDALWPLLNGELIAIADDRVLRGLR